MHFRDTVFTLCIPYVRCANQLDLKMDGGNRIKPINNFVYIMIKYPNSFKLTHKASSAELSAWL